MDADVASARLVEREVELALSRHERVVDCAVVLRGRPMGDQPAERCVHCGISGDYPGIGLDEAARCTLCVLYENNRDAIHTYFRRLPELHDLLRRRGADSEYDCLLLFSGGKDSTYVLHRLVDAGLRVMTFTFDNGFISKTALRNVRDITTALGVDHVTMSRRDQKKVFLQSLTEHKSVCNGCFRSLLDLSNGLAYERGIPSIVTGLSRGQIIDERLSWFYRQGVFDAERIERDLAVGRRVYHQLGGTADDRTVAGVEVIDYYRYSAVTKAEIRTFLDRASVAWRQPADTGFCSSNCMINDVGVYVHGKERGFHNYEAPTRWEVRLGHLDVAEADAELRAPVNIPRVKRMLARIGYPDPGDHQRLGGRLTAYYVAGGQLTVDELRTSAAGWLPEFLVPEHWVQVDAIPRAAGAVRFGELPAPATSSRFDLPLPEAEADPTFPLSSAQAAFFERGLTRPDAQARAMLVVLPELVDANRARKLALDLLLRLDALRLRFEHRAGQWRQRDGRIGGDVPVVGLDLSGRAPEEQHRFLVAAADRLRDRLDLRAGPVVRFALVSGLAETNALMIVVHELAADYRSCALLLSELAAVWSRTASPARPSFAESVTGPAIGTVDAAGARLPVVSDGPPVSHRMAIRWRAGLPAEVHDAVRTALADWLDGREVAVDLVDEPGSTVLPFGQLTGGVPARGAQVVVRHFGTPADLVAGTSFALSHVDLVDPAVLPEIAPYVLEIGVFRRDGECYLDWRCAESVYQELAAAGVPEHVAGALT